MGCSTCKSSCGREDGCGTRKAAQRQVLDGLIGRLYPSRTWGQPDDEACFRAGVGRSEALRLGRALSEALRAPTRVVPGGPDDPCTFVYALCVGRAPGLVALREGDEEAIAGAALDVGPEGRVRERYLRLCLSSIARLCAVQEVAMELDVGAPPGAAVLRELPRAGVFEPQLLKRFQKSVDLVMAHDIEHLDMGLLDLPAAQYGLAGGAYADRYGTEPSLFNFLFHAQPVMTAAATFLPAAELSAAAPAPRPAA